MQNRRAIDVCRQTTYFRARFLAMGSPCEILVATDNEAEAQQLAGIAAAEAWRVEDKFSRYLAGNTIDRINNGNGESVIVDDETSGLLDFADHLFTLSDGRFDISSGVLREVWRFDGSDRVPGSADVKRVLKRVGWQNVRWEKPELQLRPGMEIDFGGIGKEYAVDRAAALVVSHSKTPCLVNFGGDLFATSSTEGANGWHVGVDAVFAANPGASRQIRLRNGGLATSGDARRFLLKGGRRYSHILDPRSGWPVEDAPHAITVAADTCTQAGMLATLAMLQGAGAEAFLSAAEAMYWIER